MSRRRRSRRTELKLVSCLGIAALHARPARAQTTPYDSDTSNQAVHVAAPPPIGEPFLQYGVAFTSEVVASPGAMCANAGVPCVLGSGGGVVFPRIGWRSPGAWYFGGAYELSKQDANTLYPLAILQQLRGETRYYFLAGQVLTPFVGGAAGVAGYGNEWAVNTFGPAGSATFGVEAQVSRGTVVGFAFNYRVLYFRSFVDSANLERAGSVAQLVGLDIQLEVRDPY